MTLMEVRDLRVWFDIRDGRELNAVQGISLVGDDEPLVGWKRSSTGSNTDTIVIAPATRTLSGATR